jgi:hypothetical protein
MTGACWERPEGLDPGSNSGTHEQRARLVCESQGESGDFSAQKSGGNNGMKQKCAGTSFLGAALLHPNGGLRRVNGNHLRGFPIKTIGTQKARKPKESGAVMSELKLRPPRRRAGLRPAPTDAKKGQVPKKTPGTHKPRLRPAPTGKAPRGRGKPKGNSRSLPAAAFGTRKARTPIRKVRGWVPSCGGQAG